MFTRKYLGLVFLLAAWVFLSATARPAQTASSWGHSGGRSYHGHQDSHFYYGPYRGKAGGYSTYYYYYKRTPDADRYDHHTAIYYPKNAGHVQGDYFYYKNRDKTSKHFNQFWGRCRPGSDNYELLAEDKRKENLQEIAETDFVPQKRMTPVPGMTPEAPIIPPPQPTEPPEE